MKGERKGEKEDGRGKGKGWNRSKGREREVKSEESGLEGAEKRE